ncbi:hypothetical protein [Sulfurovum sp.]|uniref:hypothetical protein n=1 Tax=Sulfurovum sp. TaxID=1969726 RepID=UPI0028682E71|nr:hypothetical protein [Sulfurovum sp.]
MTKQNILFYLWKVLYSFMTFLAIIGSLVVIGVTVHNVADSALLGTLIAAPIWIAIVWYSSRALVRADNHVKRKLGRKVKNDLV